MSFSFKAENKKVQKAIKKKMIYNGKKNRALFCVL